MKYKGYMGSLLVVDLTTGKSEELAVSEEMVESYIGGKAWGAKLFLEHIPKGADPLGEENHLFFLTGPLTGTLAPATRSCVVTKSPLTNTWLDSYFGGYFGQEIKYSGYDGIIIKGKAPALSYLYIEDGRIELRDGRHLRSKGIGETTSLLERECGSAKIACIGPAGENAVKYALISCSVNRQAGRGGAGAVMGSKNLKAIVIKGSQLIRAHNPKDFLELVAKGLKELKESEAVKAFTEHGTPASIPFAHEIGTLPTKNYYYGTFDQQESIGTEAQREVLWFRDLACSSCPIACGKIGRLTKGKYRGVLSDTLEYESLGMLGSNLLIHDIKALTKIISQCDDLGLDTISAGGVLGFAMEAVEKGHLRINGKDPLQFGDANGALNMIEKIAKRQGFLGNLLAEGVKRAAREIPGSEEYAIHVKGLETPAWSPRGVPSMGLAYMTGDRGGCHQRAFPILYDVGEEWKGERLEQLEVKGKASMVVELQNYLAALDTLIKCDFGTYGLTKETYIGLLNELTGLSYDETSLMDLGGKIWDMTRSIHQREGLTKDDDTLPLRFVEEPLPDGPQRGHSITREEMNIMLQEYYSLRGWDERGMAP